MAIFYEVIGPNSKVTVEYTAATLKIDNVLTDAGNNLYNRGVGNLFDDNDDLIPWDSLINQQKLNIVDEYTKRVWLDLAREFHVSDSVDAARETAQSEIDSRHGL